MYKRQPPGWLGGGQGGGAVAFTPKAIAGLQLWLRADLGITLNVAAVSAWADQSGVGDANRNAVQATGALQPAFTASNASYNNKPTVTASGSQLLQTGTWLAGIAPPITAYVVGHTTSNAGQDGMLGGTVAFLVQDLLGAAQIVGESSNVQAASGTLNTPSISYYIADGASSAIGRNAKTAIKTGTVGAGFTDTKFSIGNFGGGGANAMNGPMAEAIIYTGHHSAGQIAQVMAYLGARYNIAIGA